jgi:cob(I)alamin adenosyltransferase
LQKGYVHVYTGNGKGKTTSAIGLGIRAAGAGLKVHMLQFMKGRKYSELNTIDKLKNFTYSQHGRDEFVNKDNPEKIDIDMAWEGFKHAEEIIKSNKYDIIILDEINVAVDFRLIAIQDVLRLIQEKPEKLELVLTGRYANPKIVESADYVTEMLEIMHPYQKGVQARKGFDF